MNRAFVLVSLALVLIFVASCIPGPNTLANSPTEEGKVAGFWQGLWHGIIAPFTFVVSLFSRNVQMYEVHNNGAWYNLGFLFGMTIILGGGGGGAARKRSRH
jgi:short subunit fatty acids transporter